MKNDFYSLLAEVYHWGNIVEPRGCKTKELIGQKLVIDSYNLFATPEHRPVKKIMDYWLNEAAWYMSGDLNPDKIIRHAKMWGEIKNENGLINSNYGHRVFYRKNEQGVSMFEFALTCLQADNSSRNAIIPYNEPSLCFNGNRDFICSQSQHFLIRNNELICYIHLRSSDMVYGLYYNSLWWNLVHQQMFLSLNRLYTGLKLGKIEVFISSVHIYEQHWPLVEKILAGTQERYFMKWKGLIPLNKSFEEYKALLPQLFSTLPTS